MIDKNKIVELAKKRGLDIAEDTAQNLAALSLDIVDEIVKDTETPIDDLVWEPIEGTVRKKVAELVDKIDGEKDIE